MKKQRFFLLGVLLLLCGLCHAQDVKVTAFQRMDRDLMARTQERLDLNDDPCAIVRISVADVKEYTFEGNIIGDVIYKTGEAIVYMTQGSRNITIKSDKFGSLRYEFTQKLEKQVVYKMTLKFIESDANRLRTLLTPVVGVGSDLSYGLMIGVVKKTGWYLKAKYDFKSLSTDTECDKGGNSPDGEAFWFTGEKKSSRLAITTGMMLRLAKPFYLYGGAGWGYRKLAWETADKLWAECNDLSYSGVEVDLGCVLRAKSVAFTAGIQSNSFKYWETTVGIGIMF